jgi:putative phosphoribosyl transferase
MAHQLLQRKTEQAVRISLGDGSLEGNLTLPEAALDLVIFAHGSGSSRLNPRSRFVADMLHEAGLGTLLIDLVTRKEERVELSSAQLRFDIPLAAARLIRATDWLSDNPVTRQFRVGYFGASTDAAAALVAAAGRPAISAIVSLGGRPDLAGSALAHVHAAVLLIVGGSYPPLVDRNEEAYKRLSNARKKELQVIPGASQLFEEPHALEEVSRLAAHWFIAHTGGQADHEAH